MPYLNVTEVESALIALNVAHPELCELITLPNLTHEGRTSHAIRLGVGPLDNRPTILFIGGQHAREWGSCEICINVATDLIDAYIASAGLAYGGKAFTATQVKSIIEKCQIFIFPCVNPDGRNHSQTVSPMWRKNRNPAGPVDVNRNYDFLWDFQTAFSPTAPVSVSDIPSSNIYHGTAPASEPETRNVIWLLDTYPQIQWMIDIHSHSRLLYHNWGDDENQTTDSTMNFRNATYDGQRGISGDTAYREFIRREDQAVEMCLVHEMRDALQAVRGETYSVGQSFALYPTCGTAPDYSYSRHWVDPTKIKTLGFLIEWGTEFQPPWVEMENIILDVSSALVAFAVAAPGACYPHLATVISDDGNFGDGCLGSFADELLIINNTSAYASLEISNITSSSPADFLAPSVISYPLVVGPRDSINVVIRFQPTSFGPKSATLTLTSNDPASPHTIEVTGDALTPRLVMVTANTGNFGKVCVGSFIDGPLILSNSGKCTLSVNNITSSSVEFIAPQGVAYPVTIEAGNSLSIPIRFEPASFGSKSATLRVDSDDPASPHTIDVSGEAPSGKLAITGSLCFDGVMACCTAERTLSISNTGDCKLNVTSVAFKRKNRHWKLINNPFPATLHPGACLGVVIRYKATEKCPRCCELVITSDDPVTPIKTLDLMAYTIWNACNCKQCCEECRKGCCEKRHAECCSAECYDDCCDDDNDRDEGEDDN